MISQKRSSSGVRGAFVHQHGRAGRERAVDDVAVPGDPAAVGRAPEDVVVAMVEDPLEGLLDEQVVAGGRVLDALGFTGRAAGVEDEQRCFAVERLGRAIGRRPVPSVRATRGRGPACIVRHRFADAAEHDAVLDGRRFGQRFVDRLLERQRLPRRQPPSAVISSLACASLLRSAIASAEKPAKITEWIAPMRRRRAWRSPAPASSACRS